MTQSIFIASETKPGKSKISSLLKAIGFVERTATPLWSYTYTRLRVDQVDFRDDYYEDSDWLYETDFDTKWAVRISLHKTHKPHHAALWKSLALIVSQVYDVQTVFVNQNGSDVPGQEVSSEVLLDGPKDLPETVKETVEEALEESAPPRPPAQESAPPPAPASEDAPAQEDDDFYPEPEVRLVSITPPEEDSDDEDDDWGDDWDDEIQFEEDSEEDDEDDEDLWPDEEEDEEEDDGDEDFDGIVTWD